MRGLVGLAPQEVSLYPELSAEENLRFFGRLNGVRGAALDARVRRRLFTGERAMVVHCELRPGTVVPLHAHKVEQFTTCLTGRIEVRLDQRRVFLAPGRAVRIPAAVPHEIRVLDPAGAETLNVFEPQGSGGRADL